MPEYGYHSKVIEKGELGEYSKIREEFEEFTNAVNQKLKIMALLELSDLYGAIEAYVEKHGLTMEDIKNMSNTTKEAFVYGYRN